MDNRTNWGMFGAVGAALAASACCTIPLLLVSLGAGGAWIGTFTAVEPYRPLFIGIAVLAIGYAGVSEYRRSTGPDCDCETSMNDWLRRSLLVVGLLVTVGLIASPSIIKSATSSSDSFSAAYQSEPTQQVTLEVEGMTCETCDITVRKALTNVEGVKEAHVTFIPPQAVVSYYPSVVSVDNLIEATTNVGYPTRLKEDL